MNRNVHDIDKSMKRRVTLGKPQATDGASIRDLVRACKPLDEISMYCNLVQAEHFRDTCVVSEMDAISSAGSRDT